MSQPRRQQRRESAPVATVADDELRALVREEVRAVLRALLVAMDGPTDGYSTRRHCAAPGYSSDGWCALAKRIGVRRGRWWVVSREALAAYEAGQDNRATPAAP